MTYALFFPFDTKQDAATTMHEDTDGIIGFIQARIPTFLGHKASKAFYLYDAGAHLHMRISLPKSTKAAIRMNLRISLNPEMTSNYWGINVDLVIPRAPDAEISLTKSGTTGKPGRGEDEDFKAHLQTVHAAITTTLDPEGGARDIIENDACTNERRDEIVSLITKLAQDARILDDRRTKNTKNQEEIRAAEINNLADGTPLVIRPAIYSRSWQLGIKRGNMPKALALHVRLATPEEISSDKMQEAGLSRHSTLILGALATKSVADYPNLVKYLKPSKGAYGKSNLDTSCPFHDSFKNPEDIKARRKDMPVIWMQTSYPHRIFGYTLNFSEAGHYGSLPEGRKAPSPNFPEPVTPGYRKAPGVFCFSKIETRFRDDPVLDLERICGIWVISQALADVLRAHNLGKNKLQPVMFVDQEGCHMEGRYMLVMHENHPSVIQSQSPADLMGSLTRRGAKDFEIAVDPSVHGDLDLWFDSTVGTKQNPLLFSGKLMKAIKREKLAVRIGLKRCDAL